MEIWKDIKGYEGLYQVSSEGRVKSLDRIIPCKDGKTKHLKGKILKTKVVSDNYHGVGLCGTSKSIHPLVAKAFPEICGEWFEGCNVDHINTIRTDNRAINLRVCTEVENHRNPLTRKHISESKKGITPWNKGVNGYKNTKISLALKGKFCGANNPNAKPILQYSMDGVFIKEWACVKDAKESLSIKNISDNLIGRLKSAGGYIWRYKEREVV